MSDEAATKLMREIGRRIRLVRYAVHGEHVRQEFLDRTGLTKSSLDRIETGRSWPSIPLLVFLKREYELTYDWLLEGNARKMPHELAETIERLLHKFYGKK